MATCPSCAASKSSLHLIFCFFHLVLCSHALPPACSSLQFRCDEKGFLAICAFGLPGRSHEDGPARGIQAALAIVEAVKVSGWVG